MLYLASTSPRRSALLTAARCEFEPVEPGDEPRGDGDPSERARQRAIGKAAEAVLPPSAGNGALVLGVDTVVDLDGEELGKPDSVATAEAMIRRLAGSIHQVHSGHALVRIGSDGRRVTEAAVATARVGCASISDEELRAYLSTGLWQGKAGAYGIQDDACWFMRLIDGDEDTVIGLSLRMFHRLLVRSCLSH